MRIARGAAALAVAAALAGWAHGAGAVPPGANGQIAFTSNRDDPSLDLRGNFEIYTASADGGHVLRLTKAQGIDGSPVWSPDKRKLVFRSNRDHFDPDPTKTTYELYAMNPDGSGQRRLTTNEADDLDPAWSPSGSIAFATDRDGNFEIYVMNADGSTQANVTKSATDELTPAWAPDGKRLAFGRTGDIYAMGSDGSRVTRLTTDARVDMDPAWSASGRRIVFTSFRDGNAEVYVMNADGSGQTRLTTTPGTDFQPTGSPDGRKILFSSDRDSGARGLFHLYAMNPDGSGAARVLSGDAADLEGDWQALITRPLAIASVSAALRAHARACKLKLGRLTAQQAAGGYKVTAQVTLAGKKATAVYLALGGAPKPSNATARRIDRGCR